MEEISVSQLCDPSRDQAVEARLRVQLERFSERETRQGKAYHQLGFTDGAASFVLRVWSDSPLFQEVAGAMREGAFYELAGTWNAPGDFGPEPRQWSFRLLDEGERDQLLEGPPDLRDKLAADYRDIEHFVDNLSDPRLRAICAAFLERHGEAFRRTAAAREYHHARRGGLVEHVAQMMRSAAALCGVYREANRDLILAGVLFHDCGKIWETCYEKNGFRVPFRPVGELLGHINIGLEIINRLWREVSAGNAAAGWETLAPPSDDVRLHLLHLVAAHHGSHEFGSPVLPRTPEAVLLHFVDNIDAKLEMFAEGYTRGERLASAIYKRVRPLPANLVDSLPAFAPAEQPFAPAEQPPLGGANGRSDELREH